MKDIKIIIIFLFMVLVLGGCSHNALSPKTNAPAVNETDNSSLNNQAPAESGVENNNINNENSVVAEVSAEIKNFAFSPASLTVKAGTTVVWTNNDSAPHNVKSDVLDSPNMAKGDSFRFTFKEAGEYNYICGIHPSMKAKIIVE